MATSSFDKHFILKTEEEVNRFYESFNAKKSLKLIDRNLTSPETEREVEKKLKHLFSR